MCLLEKILIKILVGIYKIIYTPGVESPLLSLSGRGVRKKDTEKGDRHLFLIQKIGVRS